MQCDGCGHENRITAAFCESCGARLDSSTEAAWNHDLQTSHDFVGYRGELNELVAALDDTISGKGKMFMLTGEAGIGKTRLAQELAGIAEQRGAQVLWGRCYDGDGAPPYWPWVQFIRTFIQDSDPGHLSSLMGTGASDIAEIVPQLKEKLPNLDPPPALEPESARFRLFDSVSTFLTNASFATSGRPLVLVLDNLHWADTSSLLLLEFLAPELERSRILVLGTYRDVDVPRRHPLSQSLGNLIRESGGGFQRVQLRGITQEEVARFIELTSEISAPPDVVSAVHSRTEGNPLFVTEIVRLMKEEGQDWDARIPEGIRDAIGRRLSRLSDDCNGVLTVASVIGREFSLQQLVRLVDDQSEDELLDLLDEASEGHAIEEADSGVGFYQFTHSLIQQTLSSELSTRRRVRMHKQIAEALEEIYGDGSEAHAGELAHHYHEASVMIGSEKMVHYSLVAGESALASYAWEDAHAHFELALAVNEEQPMSGEMAGALFGLARAQSALLGRLDLQQAADMLRRAFDAFVQIGDEEGALKVALNSFPRVHGPQGLTDMYSEAIKIAPPQSHEEGRLLVASARLFSYERADYDAAERASAQALEIADVNDDPALEAFALANAAQIEWLHLHLDKALEHALRAVTLSRQVGDTESEMEGLRAAMIVLTTLGDSVRASEHVLVGLELADKLRSRMSTAFQYAGVTTLAVCLGDWARAREFGDKGLTVTPTERRIIYPRMCAEYQTGNFTAGRRYLADLAETGYWSRGVGYAARLGGDVEAFDFVKAEEQLWQELASPTLEPSWRLVARVSLALIAVQNGDAKKAEEQYPYVNERPGILVPNQNMSTDHVLGLVAHAMGNLDDAQGHFEDALTFCRNAGYLPELAWTCYDYATLKHECGERNEALALLDEALTIATDLGMRPLIEKAAALRDDMESGPPEAASYPANLTERQAEVLLILSAGKTNREIAKSLVLSERTVQRHIADIYKKIDARNRAEATAFALTELDPSE